MDNWRCTNTFVRLEYKPYGYTILYKEFMYNELRFDKQILEELFDAKFLCASFHVKYINCCVDMTPGSGNHHKKWHKCVRICTKNILY